MAVDLADLMTAAVIGTVLDPPWADVATPQRRMTTTMTVVARLVAIALVAMITAAVPLRRVTSMIVAIGMDARLLAASPLTISAPLVLVTTQIHMSLVALLPVATMTPTPTVTVVAHLTMLVLRLHVVAVVAAVVVVPARLVAVLHTKATILPVDVTRCIGSEVIEGRFVFEKERESLR